MLAWHGFSAVADSATSPHRAKGSMAYLREGVGAATPPET